MTPEAGVTPALVAAVDAQLLEAKLSVPRPARSFVSRAPVIAAARDSGAEVVSVVAPAGYGKTTLLVEWALSEDRPVGWISLDSADDDPAVLLSLVATAFERAGGGGSSADVRGLGFSPLGRAAPLLAARLGGAAQPFVLMIDDLHLLTSLDCHDVLDVVLAGVPDGSTVVLASRSDQPHAAVSRARGRLTEIRPDDLALDIAGTEQVFADAGVHLTVEAARELTTRTEGWPVGVTLATMIVREGHESDVTGSDRFIADYLYAQSLRNVPQATREFLRRTAVLDQVGAELCNAVLAQTDSRRLLREVETAGLFLIPLDPSRRWFRFHTLFREYLLAELRSTEPELEPQLHARAAAWHIANGARTRAVEHLLASGDMESSAALVAAMAFPTFQVGEIATVRRWPATLGPDVVSADRHLQVLCGWIASFSGDTREAQRLAAEVRGATSQGPARDGTASFESARAMLLAMLCEEGIPTMLRDAATAVAAEPAWSPWRATALALHGEALMLSGERDAARSAYADAASAAAAATSTAALIHCEAALAVLAIQTSDWSEARQHADAACAAIEQYRAQDYATSALAYAVNAQLLARRGPSSEADAALDRAMRARAECTSALPFLAVRVRVHIASAYLAIGDVQTARHLLREVDTLLRERAGLGTLLDEVTALRRAIATSAAAATVAAAPLSPAELRLLPYLQTHLTLREIGGRLFVSRNTVSTQVSSIYRKLGVSTRGRAVEVATERGLLG